MSVEQKYDGEYYQIHVCMKGTSPQIQIFSKSSRDSTADRAGVYGAIVAGLAIGTLQCKFHRRCIMEGELRVWNESRKQIEPFRKIRKHVHRAGRRLECVPTELFKKPFIMEIIGAGFDRPADINYWTLRFPRIQKVHEDRTSKDVVSFDELQELANQCQHVAPEDVDKNVWLARLRISDQGLQQADCTATHQHKAAGLLRPPKCVV